ncbi:MAG: asnC [Subtercola sp.]|nr:asnC [Subtercola sp.]
MKVPAAPLALDDLDRRIVAALQLDPRASWSQIGKMVNTSETTALRRVQRLRDTGALIISASPDPQRCGFGQPVLLYFRTIPGMKESLADQLAQRSDIRYVSQVTGRADVMCELIAPDSRYLADVLMHQLPKTELFSSSRTEVVLKRFKTRDQWSTTLLDGMKSTPDPGPQMTDEQLPKLDSTDLQILAGLSIDGRRSYADLSTELGISETVVGRRMQSMMSAKQLEFVAMVDPTTLGFQMEAMLHLHVDLAKLDDTARAVAEMPQARYVSATSGDSDLIIDAVFRDASALYDFVSATLGKLSGIRDVEIDIVLEAIKRDYRYPLFSRVEDRETEESVSAGSFTHAWRGPTLV